ncbi:MAG TPA: alpha/beta hydrolase [Rhodopila sp.]|jgi:pimeloyl-ACP methyl ester carboxylesterase|nr:alpha/beta hydrolase [Rhodopila sp.]
MLRIYIEGDGHAWRTMQAPSDDPTPFAPIALELAATDPSAGVAYLARPCQYVRGDSACDAAVWTDRRYSETVVSSLDLAIEKLKQDAGAQRLELVGYSGGGTIAALIAARRPDVVSLRTVAANLDTQAWTALHDLSPLAGSLDPADVAPALADLPQIHFIGGGDTNVGASIVWSFLRRMGPSHCVRMVIEAGLTHNGDWAVQWPSLLAQMPACDSGPLR